MRGVYSNRGEVFGWSEHFETLKRLCNIHTGSRTAGGQKIGMYGMTRFCDHPPFKKIIWIF